MTGIPIPPPTEQFVDKETGQVNEVWYRYLEQNQRGLSSLSTASTFAQTILATTTSSQVNAILGVDASTYGSWTPTVLVGTTVVNAYALQAGRYVKRGRDVQVWGVVTVTTLTGSPGNISIGGLPVSASSTTSGISFPGVVGGYAGMNAGTTYHGIACEISTGATAVTMTLRSPSAGATIALPSSACTTALRLSVSISYETTQ